MKSTETWELAEPGDVNPRRTPRRSRRPLEPEIEVNGRKLITVRRAAEVAEVAVSTVYKWIHTGSLPHYRKGYLVRVDLADLEGI